jgi:hypothetical protein
VSGEALEARFVAQKAVDIDQEQGALARPFSGVSGNKRLSGGGAGVLCAPRRSWVRVLGGGRGDGVRTWRGKESAGLRRRGSRRQRRSICRISGRARRRRASVVWRQRAHLARQWGCPMDTIEYTCLIGATLRQGRWRAPNGDRDLCGVLMAPATNGCPASEGLT